MEETKRELSFGQKAVGLTFNPSNNAEVQQLKESFAAIIDSLNDLRNDKELPSDVHRMLAIAITDVQSAQMWAVKAVTWEFDTPQTAQKFQDQGKAGTLEILEGEPDIDALADKAEV